MKKIRKIMAWIVGLIIATVVVKASTFLALFTTFLVTDGAPISERAVANIEAAGTLIGAVAGILLAVWVGKKIIGTKSVQTAKPNNPQQEAE